ncbi:ribonuclease P protein component [Candidatus Peregrinibacteria bacterium]|nr:ribonuclease P protein component [Candidatus Peregrinibacteria bacterium]
MLKSNQRLSKQRIATILKRGRIKHSQYFNIKFLKNQQNHPRYSVIISKKVEKLATKRNRLRRQIYEIVNTEKIAPLNLDFAIICKKQCTEINFQELQTKLIDTINNIDNKA